MFLSSFLENAEAEVAFVFSKHITYLIGQQDVVLDRLIGMNYKYFPKAGLQNLA